MPGHGALISPRAASRAAPDMQISHDQYSHHRRSGVSRLASVRTADRAGHDVLCVDNFYTGAQAQHRPLLDNPRFELMRHDVTFPLYVEVGRDLQPRLPGSPDPLSVRSGADHQDQRARRDQHAGARQAAQGADPAGLDLARSTATRKSIRSRRATGAGSIRSASAAATTRASAAPRRCFSTTSASTSCDIKVVRIFNTYGPRMHPERRARGVSNFIVQALRGEDITIYGDGQQTRSFCYVDDLIEALMRMMDSDADFSGPGQHRQPRGIHHLGTRRAGASG